MLCRKQSKIDWYTKNQILAHIGVQGSNVRSNVILLKDHLHKNATTSNNTATSYPSDLTALTDHIILYADSTRRKQNYSSIHDHHKQDGDKDKKTRVDPRIMIVKEHSLHKLKGRQPLMTPTRDITN